jgi:hypothetical protein
MQTKRLAAVTFALQIKINQHIAISKIKMAKIVQKMARISIFPQRVKYIGTVY